MSKKIITGDKKSLSVPSVVLYIALNNEKKSKFSKEYIESLAFAILNNSSIANMVLDELVDTSLLRFDMKDGQYYLVPVSEEVLRAMILLANAYNVVLQNTFVIAEAHDIVLKNSKINISFNPEFETFLNFIKDVIRKGESHEIKEDTHIA